jgi:hypothetical protein
VIASSKEVTRNLYVIVSVDVPLGVALDRVSYSEYFFYRWGVSDMSKTHTSNKAKLESDQKLTFFEEAYALAHPTPDEDAVFARYLQQHGSGVGVDDADRLVKPDGADGFVVIVEHPGD